LEKGGVIYHLDEFSICDLMPEVGQIPKTTKKGKKKSTKVVLNRSRGRRGGSHPLTFAV